MPLADAGTYLSSRPLATGLIQPALMMLPATHGAPELSVNGRARDRIHRIPQRGAERGEVARPLRVGRHDRLARTRLGPIPEPLIRAEPEQLVADDGAAGAGARLILLLLRLSRLWKKLRAFSAELRWNSHAVPWKSFEPAFETMLTWPPAVWPYSAEKLWV